MNIDKNELNDLYYSIYYLMKNNFIVGTLSDTVIYNIKDITEKGYRLMEELSI